MQSPVCDLDDPVTVDETLGRFQVPMALYYAVVQILHSLQEQVQTWVLYSVIHSRICFIIVYVNISKDIQLWLSGCNIIQQKLLLF